MKRYISNKQNTSLNWYGVQLLFESIVLNSPYDQKTYEESIIIVKANSLEEAALKAEEKAINEEVDYQNVYGNLVRWKFVKIVEIYEILDNDLKQGTEVFSRYIIADKNDSLEMVMERYFPQDSSGGD